MNPPESQPIRSCTGCGNPLPEETPDTECPHCLLGLGLNPPVPDDDVRIPDDATGEPIGTSRVLGDYELLELLGAGGMGMVYKARQISLGRLVAVKMIRADPFPRPELLERFKREARTVARLHHPCIVAIHEVGELEGQPYFSMEYVEGESLTAQVRTHPLPARQAAIYICAVAEAIHYAHQQGVLHRDLKPSNILVDPFDQPRVLDFGVAKLLRGDSDLTLTGQRIGSPSYMAPEQAVGRPDQVDVRTDVYALGAVLYHLASGRPPFIADTTERALLQVVNRDPIPLRQLNPSMPQDLETICATCLTKDPAKRYPTAQAMAEDLDRYLRGQAILARPVGRAGKAWRWCRRNPLPASLGTAAAVLLVAVAIGGPFAAARQAALAKSNRRIAYGASLSAAWQSWEIGNTTRSMDLLQQQINAPNQEDLREFTWHYLWELCGPAREPNFVMDPSGAVFNSGISRDGSRFATSGLFGEVTVWDVPSRSIACRFNTGGFTSGGLTFLADDRRLITTGRHPNMGDSDQLQVWDATTGAPVDVGGAWTYAGDVSPDGRRFAAGQGADIVVREVQEGWTEVGAWSAHASPVWAVRWSPDGTRLVSAGGKDQTAAVWDVSSRTLVHRLSGHTGEVRYGVFSPDGRRIATTGEDRTVRFWDADTGAALIELGYAHNAGLHEVTWSPGGTWFASASFDGLVKLRNWLTGATWTLRGHAQTVGTLRFVPHADQLITAALDGVIRFWDLTRLPPPDTPLESSALGDESVPVAFSPNCRWVATANTNATEVLLWQVATGELGTRIRIDAGELQRLLPPPIVDIAAVQVNGLLFLDDHRLAVACDLGKDSSKPGAERACIAVRDWQGETWVDAFVGGAPLRLSPDGKRLAMRCQGNGVMVRDLETIGGSWPQPNRDARLKYWGDMAFTPDGTSLAVACAGYRLVMLDAASGNLIGEFEGAFVGPVNAIALSPDGGRLFTGGYLRRLQVWDVRHRTFVEEWSGHTNHVRAMAISPDGETLVTGSDNGLIKFWSVAQRTELLTLHAHDSRLLNLTFSPDGQTLASAGMEGTARLWRAAPED